MTRATIVAGFGALAAAGAPWTVTTPRGATVSVLTDVPAGQPPFAALIIAPGAGYSAERPLHAELAAAAAGAGWIVFRMDWAYWSAGGQASEDLSAEREDLRAVIAGVRSDPRVDPARIALAGKSLGSLVAYRVFESDPELRALALLTPICARSRDGVLVSRIEEHYPGLAKTERPVVVLYGTEDPAGCAGTLPVALGDEARHVTVLAVPGDHGLETGDPDADAENVRSAAAAVVKALGAP